jgi:hypothetical protein
MSARHRVLKAVLCLLILLSEAADVLSQPTADMAAGAVDSSDDLPPGTTFQVFDENRETLSPAHESKDGQMIVTDEELAEMRKAAKND